MYESNSREISESEVRERIEREGVSPSLLADIAQSFSQASIPLVLLGSQRDHYMVASDLKIHIHT
jgi:hypothetical protein